MTNYKEILRLARSGGFSQREVASILRISRNTVSACIARAKEKGIPNPVPESMTNQELAVLAVAVLFGFAACEEQGYKIPTGLTISTTKTSYLEGQAVDLSTVTGKLEYSDGTFRTIAGNELGSVTLEPTGTITATYNDLLAKVDVTMYGYDDVTALAVSDLPTSAKVGKDSFEVPAVATLPDGTTANVKANIAVAAIAGNVGDSVAVTVNGVTIVGDAGTTALKDKTTGIADDWKVTIVNSTEFDPEKVASIAIVATNTTTPKAGAKTPYVDDVLSISVVATDAEGATKTLTSSEYGVMSGKTLASTYTVKEDEGAENIVVYLLSNPGIKSDPYKTPVGTAWVESVTFKKSETASELSADGGTLTNSILKNYYTIELKKHGETNATFDETSTDFCIITNDTWAENTSTAPTTFRPTISVKVGRGATEWVSAPVDPLAVTKASV